MKSLTKVLLVSVMSLSLARCAELGQTVSGPGAFCAGENAPLCIFIALAIGGVAGAALGPGAIIHHVIISDERLKTDVQYYQTTANGVKLYGYRYKGDDRVFIGAMAQDLLKDKRFKSAVTVGKDGYYRVDYSKLGLKLVNAGALLQAGEAAARAH